MGPFSRIVEITVGGVDGLVLQATQAQTITIPFEFEAVPLSTPTTPQLLPDFGSVAFINQVGSSALTLFSMLDALAFLGTLIVIYLAIRGLWWLYKFVTEQPTDTGSLNVSGGISLAEDITGDEAYSAAGKVLNYAKRSKGNPFKF